MSDNILSAVLTFSLLAGGSAAIGSEMFGTRQPAKAPTADIVVTQGMVAAPAAPAEIVTLPMVTVTAQRAAPVDVVTLPMVMVSGQRQPVTVAAETRASESPRVQ